MRIIIVVNVLTKNERTVVPLSWLIARMSSIGWTKEEVEIAVDELAVLGLIEIRYGRKDDYIILS